jgi:hypothetical protein
MTDAVPITIPRPVRKDRTGFARKAWTLNPSASPQITLIHPGSP